MKKQLNFIADRGEALTLDQLEMFLADARRIGCTGWDRPVIEVEQKPNRLTKIGRVKRASIERNSR
jgi:hypothetical protein